jgi:hypothetical protein
MLKGIDPASICFRRTGQVIDVDLGWATASIMQTLEEPDHGGLAVKQPKTERSRPFGRTAGARRDAARAGTTPKVIQEARGHASMSITHDIFGHLMPGMQQEAANRIDTLLRTHLEQALSKPG